MAVAETPAADRPLAGIGVLITRPAHQAEHLAQLIEQAGGVAVRFPTIEIAPPADPSPLLTLLDRLHEFDVAIFVSPNAVEQTLGWLHARKRTWPPHLPVACVGKGSARLLEQSGIRPITPPNRFDSEALLALPALQQVTAKKAVIFRGDGGRPLLGDTLARRGAQVTYAECYRRVAPRGDAARLLDDWARGEIQIVSITSTEGLHNLHAMLGQAGRAWLAKTPVVVLSHNQAAACRRLGVASDALIATEASDEAILETIKTWRLGHFSL